MPATDAALTFIVPVRHPENARDWPSLKARLVETARSIAGQDDPSWRGVVVANRGSDLPRLPRGFSVVEVELPPNPAYDLRAVERDRAYEAVRLDKGMRILAGLRAMRPSGHVMAVDDDDLVSRRLAGFVAARSGADGWRLERGYVWGGGRLLYLRDDFSNLCGTSHIVRADLYRVAGTHDLPEHYVKRTFGSHKFIADDLCRDGHPLIDLPFPGAVYRVGHAGAHSRSLGVLGGLLRDVPSRPRAAFRRSLRLRTMNRAMWEEFGGRERRPTQSRPARAAMAPA